MKNPLYTTLARNLCAAYNAYHTGVTLSTAHKNLGEEDVGEFWHQIAEAVEKAMQQNISRLLGLTPEPARPQ